MTKNRKTWRIVLGALVLIGAIGEQIVPTEKPKEVRSEVPQKMKDQSLEESKTVAEVNLRLYIKNKLNDPNSFEVLQQKSWQSGEVIIVMIEYTAKNGFGGVVRNAIQAEADLKGNITKVFDKSN